MIAECKDSTSLDYYADSRLEESESSILDTDTVCRVSEDDGAFLV